jgi:hypothetical protein
MLLATSTYGRDYRKVAADAPLFSWHFPEKPAKPCCSEAYRAKKRQVDLTQK